MCEGLPISSFETVSQRRYFAKVHEASRIKRPPLACLLQQRAKELLDAELEKLPTINSCAIEEVRPTSDMRYVKDEISAHIKYMDIDAFTEWKKNNRGMASECPPPPQFCCMPCPASLQCSPPVIQLATCPYLNPQQEGQQVGQQMAMPCRQQQYICVTCPQQQGNTDSKVSMVANRRVSAKS